MAEEQQADQAEKDILRTKQRLFVEYYLGQANGNATQAARLAGYSARSEAALRVQAHNCLTNPNISEEISRRVKEAAMAADEVLFRLASHARGSLADFVDLQDDGTWKVNLKRAEAAGKLHLLTELGYTEHGPKLKLVDSQAALVQLGRHHKLFTDKSEQDLTSDGKPIATIYIPANGRDADPEDERGDRSAVGPAGDLPLDPG